MITNQNIVQIINDWFINKESVEENYGKINDWDVSNVTDMSEMFYGTTNPKISFLYVYAKPKINICEFNRILKSVELTSKELEIINADINGVEVVFDEKGNDKEEDNYIAQKKLSGRINTISTLQVYFGTYLKQEETEFLEIQKDSDDKPVLDSTGEPIMKANKSKFLYGILPCKIWDTEKVTDMSKMFGNTNLDSNLDIPFFHLINTDNVTNISEILENNSFTSNLSYMNLNNCNNINNLVKSEYPSYLKPKLLLIKEHLLNNDLINENDWQNLNFLINKDKLNYKDISINDKYDYIMNDNLEINTINSDFLKNQLLTYTENNTELFKLYCQHKLSLLVGYSIKNNQITEQLIWYIFYYIGIDFQINDFSLINLANKSLNNSDLNKFHIQFDSKDILGKQIINESLEITDNIKYILNSFMIIDFINQKGEGNQQEFKFYLLDNSFNENTNFSYFIPINDYDKLITEYSKYLEMNLFFMFYNINLLAKYDDQDVTCFTLLNENELIALNVSQLLIICSRVMNEDGNEKYQFKIKNTNKTDYEIEFIESEQVINIAPNSIESFEDLNKNTIIKIDNLYLILDNGLLITPISEQDDQTQDDQKNIGINIKDVKGNINGNITGSISGNLTININSNKK